MENQHPEEAMSAEELAMRKEEMLKFYTDSLPYLEAQFKYEETLMRLDEVRFKRTSIQMQFAMLMQGPGEDPEEDEFAGPVPTQQSTKEEPKEKKLKRS